MHIKLTSIVQHPALETERLEFVPKFWILVYLLILLMVPSVLTAQNFLPSWNDGAAKNAILNFVSDVTKEGSQKFVPPAERIAVFDNDGTLWAEQPMYFQFAFAFDEIKRLAPNHSEWKEKEPFKSVIAGDTKTALAGGEKSILQLIMAAHSRITTEEFSKNVSNWIATAKNPKFNRLYVDCIYIPMAELLSFLRVNGFRTFIVSGGGVEFMRVWAEKAYGIPPEQVVGSSGKTKFEKKGNQVQLIKLPEIEFVDDGPGKPVGINRFIGRRPILAFGNSDGDQQMLQYTAAGPGARLMLILHHDDADREVAYDRQSHIGKLDKAWDEAIQRGWIVVSMKNDFKAVFK